jgi:hypothetical protein
MSVAEMKLEVIGKITKLENEAVLKEVLALLKQPGNNASAYNLSSTYHAIKEQYGDVLQKLAQ